MNHPARANHRIIPITVGDIQGYFLYSPYVYYIAIFICGCYNLSIGKREEQTL